MKNTNLAKDYLAAAYRILTDNSFADARFKITGALKEIEKVESKRQTRAAVQKSIEDQWKEKLAAAASNSTMPKESLGQIEKMIEDEKSKIKNTEPQKKQITLLD